jgi:hypothetical protein
VRCISRTSPGSCSILTEGIQVPRPGSLLDNPPPASNSEDFHKVSPDTSVDAMCNEDHVSHLRQQKVET